MTTRCSRVEETEDRQEHAGEDDDREEGAEVHLSGPTSIDPEVRHYQDDDYLEDRLAPRKSDVPHVEPCNLGRVRLGLREPYEYPHPVRHDHPEPLCGEH